MRGLTSKQFSLWHAEELEITVQPVGQHYRVRVEGDYEVGKARFFLTADEMIEMGEWLMNCGREYNETTTEVSSNR